LLTHNFKNAILNAGSIYYTGYYFDQHYEHTDTLYFIDMKNQKRQYKDYRVPFYSFFYGGSDGTHPCNRTILDYNNLDDMLASKNFYYGGGRSQTTSQDFDDSWTCMAGVMIVGSGDTPPTPDDYCLDSWIPTTELHAIAYGGLLPKTIEDDFIGGFTATFYNVSQENKTVKEVGLMSFYANNKLLMAREVLETPVIIKPQDGCTFNFIIK
jgi:hypothetical protein